MNRNSDFVMTNTIISMIGLINSSKLFKICKLINNNNQFEFSRFSPFTQFSQFSQFGTFQLLHLLFLISSPLSLSLSSLHGQPPPKFSSSRHHRSRLHNSGMRCSDRRPNPPADLSRHPPLQLSCPASSRRSGSRQHLSRVLSQNPSLHMS